MYLKPISLRLEHLTSGTLVRNSNHSANGISLVSQLRTLCRLCPHNSPPLHKVHTVDDNREDGEIVEEEKISP